MNVALYAAAASVGVVLLSLSLKSLCELIALNVVDEMDRRIAARAPRCEICAAANPDHVRIAIDPIRGMRAVRLCRGCFQEAQEAAGAQPENN